MILQNNEKVKAVDHIGQDTTRNNNSLEVPDDIQRAAQEEYKNRRTSNEGLNKRESINNEGGSDGEQYDGGQNDTLQWDDFNVNFHSSVPDIQDPIFTAINEQYGQKVIDLRPYMVARPFTVFENDPLQKCVD